MPSSGESRASRSVRVTRTASMVWPWNGYLLASSATAMVVAVKVTPGMWREVRVAATSAALNHAAGFDDELAGALGTPAPKISKGDDVPRPTEMLVKSM